MPFKKVSQGSEEGSVIVETTVALSILAMLICAVIEFGAFAIVNAAVDDASYAACRALAQDTSLTVDDLKRIAADASPSIAESMSVPVRTVGAVKNNPYTHHMPNETGERASNAAVREVSVEISASYTPLTGVGRLIAGGGNITFASKTFEVADATVEEGGSPW